MQQVLRFYYELMMVRLFAELVETENLPVLITISKTETNKGLVKNLSETVNHC